MQTAQEHLEITIYAKFGNHTSRVNLQELENRD